MGPALAALRVECIFVFVLSRRAAATHEPNRFAVRPDQGATRSIHAAVLRARTSHHVDHRSRLLAMGRARCETHQAAGAAGQAPARLLAAAAGRCAPAWSRRLVRAFAAARAVRPAYHARLFAGSFAGNVGRRVVHPLPRDAWPELERHRPAETGP